LNNDFAVHDKLHWSKTAVLNLLLQLTRFWFSNPHKKNMNLFVTRGTYMSHLQRVFSSPLG